ncbi:hypothetical protein [Novipirellula artificiosorum]|uniref:Leucine Rich repeats (2 copies) n=1 Tax=Novipirellula artificiosorum TaxID=2528016 RepID=A0A5C6DWR6_9BACT|nr:hypothetical protein [Novipirellula artificiosorum]TWU41072.1 hypothetical protein Poly41_19090 [Novipirellula artificiosorum]
MAHSAYRIVVVLHAIALVVGTGTTDGADRSTFAVSMPADASGHVIAGDVLFADAKTSDPSWHAYVELWRAHAEDPSAPSIRRFLGLPLSGKVEGKISPGRSAPAFLRFARGSYQQMETPHFQIMTRASPQQTGRVAEDLEQCYWVWTQMFFPLWEDSVQVASAFSQWSPDEDVAEFLAARTNRLRPRRKMRVVLLRDANEYVRALADRFPGIQRSTGFYDDANRTMFLYAGAENPLGQRSIADTAAIRDAEATRRHELTHQLFREATPQPRRRSFTAAADRFPGEESGFWLIEGIAGYFESMVLTDRVATLGGWDASRLQYSRFRTLVGGDFMPLSELRPEGRVAAQQRADLARWYAHAIALTHLLVDGDRDPGDRRWVFNQLARLYAIDLPFADSPAPEPTAAEMRAFLSVSDVDLLENPAIQPLARLCLAGCEVTEEGLRSIPPQTTLDWLDLSRIPVTSDEVKRLVADPGSLAQISLEATSVDDGIAAWIARAKMLRELDLSFTYAGDLVVNVLRDKHQLDTLWLTGTQVSDAAMPVIESLEALEAVDLQRTKVTESAATRFQLARPKVKWNPLELRGE